MLKYYQYALFGMPHFLAQPVISMPTLFIYLTDESTSQYYCIYWGITKLRNYQ